MKDAVGQVAAHRTEAADTGYIGELPRAGLSERKLFRDCPRRTCIDAVSAGDAVCLEQLFLHGRFDHRFEPSIDKAQGSDLENFRACSDASAAVDTFIRIQGDEGMILVHPMFPHIAGELRQIHPKFGGIFSQIAVKICRTSAFKAAPCFVARLFGAETHLDLIEIFDPFCDREFRHPFPFNLFQVYELTFRDLPEDLLAAHKCLPVRFGLSCLHVLVDHERRNAAVGDCIDGDGRTRHGVAAGKDPWNRCLECCAVRCYSVLPTGLQLAVPVDVSEIDVLSYGRNGEIAGKIIL
ncbi:MAG: hypothetical protein A4E62_01018 [Syntrophorhabdus sp. PtaU1.Bin002]|nr:MAG: hypothetical protein A4E62_01018 [Syntrophorhabdus sp. PtaU1.Bin002]